MLAWGQGLGVVVNTDGSYDVPSWCSWLPFSSFNDACKLPTPAQVQANDLANLGPAAARVAELQQQWAQTDAMLWSQNPDEYAAYQFAVDNPAISAAIGTGPTARAATQAAAAVTGALDNWTLYAAAAGAAVLVILLLRR
jgi:hypothetical protein